jgi:hypothetical protein
MAQSFRRGRKLTVALERSEPLASVPFTAECVALARDVDRAEVQDRAGDLCAMSAADVDTFAHSHEG